MATWDIETVKKAIDDVESERSVLNERMRQYEAAWKLEFWSAEDYKQADDKQWRLYTSPEPRNMVNLMMSLVCGKMKVICPTYEKEGSESLNAEIRGRFLELLIEKQSHLQELSLLESLSWYGAVRGRMVVQVAWIWNTLSEDEKKFMPPLIYRVLDPLDCGFKRGPYGVQYAFHKYSEDITTAKDKYPSLFKEKQSEGLIQPQKPESSEVTKRNVDVIQFWYKDKGKVYHCVLIDDEFAKKPTASQFPIIPIFERSNDASPHGKERWKSGSVLEGTLGTWAELNHLLSAQVTAVRKKFFPAKYFSNEQNLPEPTLDDGADAVNFLPDGITPLPRPDDRPDVSLLTSATEVFEDVLQKSAFPNSLYGDTGAQRAGYAASLLMSTAARRAYPLKEQLQLILEEANSLALAMLKKFSPGEIELYGYNYATHQGEQVKIDSDTIGDRYDNKVNIAMVLPGADLQKMNMYLQMRDAGLLSSETALRLMMPSDEYVPEDEMMRVHMDKVMQDPDMLKNLMRTAYKEYTGRELPPGEPDGELTQQIPPVGRPEQPMPQGPPPGPMQGAIPGGNPAMGSPEFYGGMSPDMMGMVPGDPNTQMAMQQMNGQQITPEMQAQMLAGTFRRR